MINRILKFLFGKKEIPPYPRDFCLIDYSPIAKQEGIRDEQNKIIYRYYFGKFGNRKIKKYRYSPQRIYALREVHNLPIIDKTKREERFPVYSRILPSELEYNK